jgi:hypothetical protein
VSNFSIFILKNIIEFQDKITTTTTTKKEVIREVIMNEKFISL